MTKQQELHFIDRVIGSCKNLDHIETARGWIEAIAWKRLEPIEYETILTSLDIIELNLGKTNAKKETTI